MAGTILPVLEMTSYSETPSFAATVFPSMLSSMVAASTSGFVAGFSPMVTQALQMVKANLLTADSPIALAHDDVVGSKQRDGVRDHVASGHIIKRAHMNER